MPARQRDVVRSDGLEPVDSPDDGVPPAEYCPVSIGAKLLGDRWTLLVVRELMTGSTGFNDIHRGLPGLNRSMLSERLRHLERLGVVERREVAPDSRRSAYRLTASGRALGPVITAIGEWTINWQFPSPTDDDAAIPILLWRLYQGLDHDALPSDGISIEFRFVDSEPSRGWIHADNRSSGVCVGAPEHSVDLILHTPPRVMYAVWYGHMKFSEAVAADLIRIEGNPDAASDFPRWFRYSPFAEPVAARCGE